MTPRHVSQCDRRQDDSVDAQTVAQPCAVLHGGSAAISARVLPSWRGSVMPIDAAMV